MTAPAPALSSEASRVDRLARNVTLAISIFALVAGAVGAVEVSPEHRWMKGTAGAALTLLLASLACSPAATILGGRRPALAVALRRARRWLGLETAAVALVHATLACFGYLGGIELGAIAAVPSLRHGALALLVLAALSLTSFPVVARALRVRAWSALHRLVYAAALLVGLHALAAPLADVGGGVFALGAVVALLIARPIALALGSRQAAQALTERMLKSEGVATARHRGRQLFRHEGMKRL